MIQIFRRAGFWCGHLHKTVLCLPPKSECACSNDSKLMCHGRPIGSLKNVQSFPLPCQLHSLEKTTRKWRSSSPYPPNTHVQIAVQSSDATFLNALRLYRSTVRIFEVSNQDFVQLFHPICYLSLHRYSERSTLTSDPVGRNLAVGTSSHGTKVPILGLAGLIIHPSCFMQKS